MGIDSKWEFEQESPEGNPDDHFGFANWNWKGPGPFAHVRSTRPVLLEGNRPRKLGKDGEKGLRNIYLFWSK